MELHLVSTDPEVPRFDLQGVLTSLESHPCATPLRKCNGITSLRKNTRVGGYTTGPNSI